MSVPLTPSQEEAVTVQQHTRDTCVVAGPGSGKTTVLVEYFERLVASGVDPLRILAITFTEKAANNMRERLSRAFDGRREIPARLERANVSTVHGFCARFLKENAIFAGIDPEFYVMDEREAARIQRLAVDQTLDQMYAEQPERARGLMRGLAAYDTGAALMDAYEAIRAAGVGIAGLPALPPPQAPDVVASFEELRRHWPRGWNFDQLQHLAEIRDAAGCVVAALPRGPQAVLQAIAKFSCDLRKLKRGSGVYDLVKSLRDDSLPALESHAITESYAGERTMLCDLLARFDACYRERKRQSGALDFDDLEEYAVWLLEGRPDVRRRVQSQFDHVLMDEFQDTNGRQAKLLRLLRRPDRFYAVGDINQSIYGFRHADPEVFRAYRDAAARDGGRVVELAENFRSRPEILHAVSAAMRGAQGVEPRALTPAWPFPGKAEPSVELLAAPTLECEAQWVAARILELEGRLIVHQRPAEFRDFALLVRNSEVLPEFIRAFDACGIPYLVNNAKGFYETREAADLFALLRVLVNPRDEIAMATVLRSPFVAVSDEALFRLKQYGNIGAAVEALPAENLSGFSAADNTALERFSAQLRRWRAIRDYLGIDQLLMRAMDECGYEHAADLRSTSRIESFLAQARAAGTRQTLSEFVDEIESLRAMQAAEPGTEGAPEDSANAVKMMTVHSAKGLEFPIVFLAALNKGVQSGPGGISFLPGVGLGASWRHPLDGRDVDDAFQAAIRERLKERDKHEGHRLLYVAMTRAAEHLALSFTMTGKKPQNWAGLLQESFALDLERPREEIVVLAAPNGLARTVRVPLRVRIVDRPPDRPSPAARDNPAATPELRQRPSLTEQHDSQANVTSLALFAECPRRYYLSRHLGFERVPRAGGDGRDDGRPGVTDLGIQVHSLLAGAPLELPDAEAVRLADRFHKSPLGRRAAAATVAEREFDFLMEIENVVLRGQIDLWFEERDRTVLVDYKTDQVNAAEAPARAGRYTLQLRLYALALARLNGCMPNEAYVVFLRPNTAVPVDLRPSLIESPEAIVREFREAQENGNFPLREGSHCRACPHFGALCPGES